MQSPKKRGPEKKAHAEVPASTEFQSPNAARAQAQPGEPALRPTPEPARLQGGKKRPQGKGALTPDKLSRPAKKGKQSHTTKLPARPQDIAAPPGWGGVKQAKEQGANGRNDEEHRSVKQAPSERAATAKEQEMQHALQEAKLQLAIQRERFELEAKNMRQEITMLKEALAIFTRVS